MCPCLIVFSGQAQTVGVVLSGGGATGIAHVGVLKALEENNIPIDYIAGTSMGAVIGGMYAAGYSPDEIETMVRSKRFLTMVEGRIEDEYVYFYNAKEEDASLISLKFNPDSIFQTSIPTNVIQPIGLDFELLEMLMAPAAAANYDFDSLFVPYRCVASDIAAKEAVIFKDGRLTESIRASMTYPFYVKPITVDGKLLFDGGLYNNFPTDVMYNDFFPDIIIGSNVGDALEAPNPDDPISQIMNMLLMKRNISVICENGILIEPKANVSTFNFKGRGIAIDAGYKATMAKMDSIKLEIVRRVDSTEIKAKRNAWRQKLPEPVIQNVHIEGLTKSQATYVQRILRKKKGVTTMGELKPKYFRVFLDEKIDYTYPRANFNDSLGTFDLHLEVKKERDLEVDFGGNFSSRPINTGFVGLKYRSLGRTGLTLSSNFYFGRFYGSVKAAARFDFPTRLQFYLEPIYTRNRWDYFRSQATFFEDVKPSFLIKNEQYGGLVLGLPVKNNGRVKFDFKAINLENEYYQTENFNSTDTSDITSFDGQTLGVLYERNTLNRKTYANKGTRLIISGRYVVGRENTVFGSTKPETEPLQQIDIGYNWTKFKVSYENYFKKWGRLQLGLYTEGVYTNMPFFSNYTATILSAPAFQPLPENFTLFQEQFRAHSYGTVGLRNVVSITRSLEWRVEGHLFQPFQAIIADESNSAFYGEKWENRSWMGSTSLVFHSPLGPVSLSVNYYEFNQEEPWSVLFNFGYILFNREALD